MASSLPVVGSSVIGSLFPGGRGGMTAPSGAQGEALVRFVRSSVERLDVSDPALRREMGTDGRSRVMETYAWGPVVAAHLELYRQLGLAAR